MRKSDMKKKEFSNAHSDRESQVMDMQLKGLYAAEEILTTILNVGFVEADDEYEEDLSYDTELLSKYYIPNILREMRHLLYMIHFAEEPSKQKEVIEYLHTMFTIVSEAKAYIVVRLHDCVKRTVTSTIESFIGYYWKKEHLLEHKLYENDAEVIQLAFNSRSEMDRQRFLDDGYWFNLKNGQIHHTHKIRSYRAVKHIEADNTQFDVLQIKQLFVYPGYFNKRIRWKNTEVHQRAVTSEDLAVIVKSAESDYQAFIDKLKSSFLEPLAENTPVFLIKLHKTFINGNNLVLEDEKGALLTIASEEEETSTELLQAILPSQLDDAALLVQLNNDVDSKLISLAPLSLITSKKIIRLSF